MILPATSPRDRVRRSFVAILLTAAILATVAVTAAAAAPTRGGCPPGAGSAWSLADLSAWQKRSIAGLEAEFGTVQKAAMELMEEGKRTAADLLAEVDRTFFLVDADGDGLICMSRTNPAGLPDYLINVRDNRVPLRR
jgi:hypothetical protein